jgi:3-oxoadipate CoA-transferase beta subunit
LPRGRTSTCIGQTTTVAEHLDRAAGIVLYTENGMFGMGCEAAGDEIDDDLVNAGQVPSLRTLAPPTSTTLSLSR